MSYVTNLILTFDVMEEEKEREAEIQEFFIHKDARGAGFVSCDDEKLPHGWYGGTKALETNVYIGAFNFINLDDLISHLRHDVKWEYPENVRLMICDQNEEAFRMINPTLGGVTIDVEPQTLRLPPGTTGR
jgi:hypothetical protein